ncbi:hypothetical protein HQ545_08650 [Candidatus Woesearchaeota archaeon]|nr:hypothetical protein [Candidatus Woesearchaeota archaeon]
MEHKHKKHHEKSNHKHQHKKKGRPAYGYMVKKAIPYILGAAIIIIAFGFLFKTGQTDQTDNGDTSKSGTSEVTFYVMSQCPYGTQVEDAIAPVLKEMGNSVDFRLEFIAGESGDGFTSLHGQPEVEGNIVQLCVQEHYPDNLMGFVVCQNKNPQDLKGSIEKCAEDNSIDSVKIKECADGEEGKQLLSESIKKSQAVNAQGSPTMYFNDKLYQGPRDDISFKREICKSLENHPVCEEIPICSTDFDCTAEEGKVGICANPGKKEASCSYKDDAVVALTIINSDDCTSCDTTQMQELLSTVFFNMKVRELDSSSSDGKELVESLDLKYAPSFVFQGDMENTYAWQNNERLRAAFKQVGDRYVMLDESTGSSFVLDEDERQQMAELTGVTTGDNKPQIDFYVMSYCPYGNIAEEAIEPVYQLLKDKAEFNPHYVIYSNYQGGGPQLCLDEQDQYCSMHGIQELNQGLRELCVDKYMGIKEYFRFTLEMNKKCSYQNADTCWEAVADDLGLDTSKIKDCETNEWEDILANELALNKALGVSGSPTVFVEGQAYNGARAPSGYAQALCSSFTTAPPECDTSSISALGGDATPAAAAGGCG